jgi:4a-hydroxytetrahydrobiopterin dehydratase
MAMPALSPDEVNRELQTLPGWEASGNEIRKEFTFNAYMDGVHFADRVAEEAERANHHPDMTIGYRKVTIALTSHDSGGVTNRDIRMARRIDELPQGAGTTL